MNNEKLNIQYFIDSVSAKTGHSKKDSERQIKDFVNLMRDSLLQDGLVKIKGLGTLKLIWNKSRKSINVQTGEEIEIAGHYKIDFTPENSLKDFANQPFAHLENTILDDEVKTSFTETIIQNESDDQIQKFNAQALEIKSLLNDINASIPNESNNVILKDEDAKLKECSATSSEAETTVSNNKTTNASSNITEESSEHISQEGTITNNVEVQNDFESTTVTTVQSSSEPDEKEESFGEDEVENETSKLNTQIKSKGKNGLLWFIVVLLIVILSISAYCYLYTDKLPTQIKESIEQIKAKINGSSAQTEVEEENTTDASSPTDQVEEVTSLDIIEENNNDEVDSTIIEEEDNSNTNETETIIQEQDFCASNFAEFDINSCEILDIVEVTEGKRLAFYANKYYGSYVFWPYIYAANKDILSSPNDLAKGQKLKIPQIPSEMLNINDETAVKWCEECMNK